MPDLNPAPAKRPRDLSSAVAVQAADIVRVYDAVADGQPIHGVSFDGTRIWAATGAQLVAIDPDSGRIDRRLQQPSDAGTAFDGRFLYQITGARIDRIDPASGEVLGSIPAPGAAAAGEGSSGSDSGLAWADGSLWVGQYRDRRIHKIDPETGAILKTIESDRFVTGVTWVEGELWHGTWEGDESEVRRIDPGDGTVLTRLKLPAGMGVSGMESDGRDRFYCGGGGSGSIRAVRRPSPSKR